MAAERDALISLASMSRSMAGVADAPTWCMRLASGVTIGLRPSSEHELHSVEQIANAMCLEIDNPDAVIEIGTGEDGEVLRIEGSLDTRTRCLTHPGFDRFDLGARQSIMSAMAASIMIERGAFLLHAGLATWNGKGVLFAAQGDGGKSTTCSRLPRPWRVLSDDACLVSWNHEGLPWAHPWPTWSRFDCNGPGGAWSFDGAVPIRLICFLEKSEEDDLRPLGMGEALSRLLASAEQITQRSLRYMRKEQARSFRNRRLEQVIQLSRTTPSHELLLTLTGDFWTLLQIELEKPGSAEYTDK